MNIKQFVASWKTSLTGFIVGAVWYLSTSGAQFPQNRNDVWHLVIGVLFAGFGLMTKDADRGASTKQTPESK